MRKLSLLGITLVFGLVIGLVGFNALAGNNGTDPVNLNRSNGALSVTVDQHADSGGIIDFDPTSTTEIGTTVLKVVSGGHNWELSVDSDYPSVTNSPGSADNSQIIDHFNISLNATTDSDWTEITVDGAPNKVQGSNGEYSIEYDYTWDTMTTPNAAQYMPNGDYEIEIQYTVASTD